MPRWLLVAILYADGQTLKQIAAQLGVSSNTTQTHLKVAKGVFLGVTSSLRNGRLIGAGSKLDLRAALVEDGHLT
jgi:hypothetical protein